MISGFSTIPMEDPGTASSIFKKKSQSSKPLRMVSSYPPHSRNALRRKRWVAGQALCERKAAASPPDGRTTAFRTPNVCSQEDAAIRDGFSIRRFDVSSRKDGSRLSSPSSTNTKGERVRRMPQFLAADTPPFGWRMTSRGTDIPRSDSSSFKMLTDISSVEPSSTTRILTGFIVWRHTDSTASQIIDFWLKLVITASIVLSAFIGCASAIFDS